MDILILVIIIIFLFLFAYLVCGAAYKMTSTIEEYDNILAYANTADPYDKPSMLYNVITPEHADAIMEYSKDKLVDSEVVGGKHQNIRNSQQTWIPKEHPLVRPIFEKVGRLYGVPFQNAEDLQVVRYKPGQYYNEHHDACCDANDKCQEFVNKGGQRKLTVLIYLNNDFTEGETYFRNLDLKIKPKPGDAVIFYPLAKNSNKCHPLALHAGLSVSGGEKWVCNVWFREGKFR